MTRIHDISLAIDAALPTWPSSEGWRTRWAMRIADGDSANVTVLEADVHTGTHVESGLHFLADGETLDRTPLERFVGPAMVVDVGADVDAVDADALARALEGARVDGAIPDGATRLLIKTRNSERWAKGWGPFDTDFVSLTVDAAEWIAGHGFELAGIDHLSIQQYGSDGETHRVLMRAGVTILEGLNLAGVATGEYTLVAAPIKLVGTEAAPVRALLIDRAP
jgi:arylformamidase